MKDFTLFEARTGSMRSSMLGRAEVLKLFDLLLALCVNLTSHQLRLFKILLFRGPALLQTPIVFIFNASPPHHFEDLAGLLLLPPLPDVFLTAAGPFFELVSCILCVLPPPLVVRVSPGSGHSHLNKLSGHVGADKILPFHRRLEDCPEDFGRVAGNGNRAKRPVRRDVTLVWLKR